MTGHSVLAVPVPELDAFVRARTGRADPSFLGRDDSFVNAHVTVLGPWLADPTDDDLAAVAGIVEAEKAFDVTFEAVGGFLDGIINILPEPSAPFARLTSALHARFPQTPPYAGRFDVVVPHLTLDHHATGASVESVRAELADLVPVRTRVERVDLQWWANDDCHVRASWRLG